MIVAGGLQGDELNWQHYMLIVSHLGMAAEALVYAPLFAYSAGAVALVGAWTLSNDWMDYGVSLFPWLPRELEDDLPTIARFTVALSFLGLALAFLFRRFHRTRPV